MEREVSELVANYEAGRISRRSLIKHVSALAAAVAGSATFSRDCAAADSTFKATSLNHIALRVTDVTRSRDFYMKHLGLTVARDGGTSNSFLNFGNNFVALFRGDTPGLDHYCYSVENYDVSDAVEKLKAAGLTPRQPRGTGRVYFPDPDGLTVQLAASDHRP